MGKGFFLGDITRSLYLLGEKVLIQYICVWYLVDKRAHGVEWVLDGAELRAHHLQQHAVLAHRLTCQAAKESGSRNQVSQAVISDVTQAKFYPAASQADQAGRLRLKFETNVHDIC